MSGATGKDLQLSVAALRLQTWTQRECSPVHVELRLHLVWPNTKPRMPSRYREGLAAKAGISIGQQILQAAFVTAPSFGDPKLLPKCSSMLHSGHLSLTASVGYMMVILFARLATFSCIIFDKKQLFTSQLDILGRIF